MSRISIFFVCEGVYWDQFISLYCWRQCLFSLPLHHVTSSNSLGYRHAYVHAQPFSCVTLTFDFFNSPYSLLAPSPDHFPHRKYFINF